MRVLTVFNPVRQYLRDQSTTPRWTDTALYRYLQEAENVVVGIVPGAAVRYDSVKLTPNEVRHDVLASDVRELLSVERNMGSSGNTPGQPITLIDKSTLDQLNRGWASRAGEVIDNYAIDEADNRRFYTFPKVSATIPVWVELRVSRLAPLLSETDDDVMVPEKYRHVLAQMIAGWALMEDDAASDISRGKELVDAGYRELGLNIQGRMDVKEERKGSFDGNKRG